MKVRSPREVVYPESDGKPMAETDVHRDWMVLIIERLKARYRGKRVYVSGNLLIYYEEGNPKKSVAPDVFAVLECEQRRRRTFKVWEEGRGPNFILETTSGKTRREDQGPKPALFAKLRVPEFFLYDPLAEWLKPPLQGFRLNNGHYEPIRPEADGSLISKQLGIRFLLEDGELAMFDVKMGERILSDGERMLEAERQNQEMEKRLAEERAARRKLQEELARLKGKRGNGPSRGGTKS
jgi:Uma2 family endonuclease